jgi:hypothetical protein
VQDCERECEDSRRFWLAVEGQQFDFICNHPARGRGYAIIMHRTMRFPKDRTIHDPDKIRSRGQMEAVFIRPIVQRKLWKWGRCGVDAASHSSEQGDPSSDFCCSLDLHQSRHVAAPPMHALRGPRRIESGANCCCFAMPCMR